MIGDVKGSAALIAKMAVCMNLAFCASDCIIIECERFDDTGGWTIVSQFIDEMGSGYLLAHGVGYNYDAKRRLCHRWL